MSPISRLWYHLTAYVPRRLPASPEQYERMKQVLIHAFGLPDEPQVWVLVSGQITSHPSNRIRKPWGHIANCAKRLAMNKMVTEYKEHALEQLNVKLKAAMKRQADALKLLDDVLKAHPDMCRIWLEQGECAGQAMDFLVDSFIREYEGGEVTRDQVAESIKQSLLEANAKKAMEAEAHGQKAAQELASSDGRQVPSAAKDDAGLG